MGYVYDVQANNEGFISLFLDISDIRLIGPSRNIGRVEAFYDDTWIPICRRGTADDAVEWNDAASYLACKHLGFEGGVAYNEYGDNLGLSSSVPNRVHDFECENGRSVTVGY